MPHRPGRGGVTEMREGGRGRGGRVGTGWRGPGAGCWVPGAQWTKILLQCGSLVVPSKLVVEVILVLGIIVCWHGSNCHCPSLLFLTT